MRTTWLKNCVSNTMVLYLHKNFIFLSAWIPVCSSMFRKREVRERLQILPLLSVNHKVTPKGTYTRTLTHVHARTPQMVKTRASLYTQLPRFTVTRDSYTIGSHSYSVNEHYLIFDFIFRQKRNKNILLRSPLKENWGFIFVWSLNCVAIYNCAVANKAMPLSPVPPTHLQSSAIPTNSGLVLPYLCRRWQL